MNEKKFLDLYQRQKESGLTVKEFCSNEIIAPATFYYWLKKLKENNRLPGFIPLIVNSAPTFSEKPFSGNHLLPSQTQPINNNPTIEIEFPNKTILRINNELDLSELKALIRLYD